MQKRNTKVNLRKRKTAKKLDPISNPNVPLIQNIQSPFAYTVAPSAFPQAYPMMFMMMPQIVQSGIQGHGLQREFVEGEGDDISDEDFKLDNAGMID